MANIDTIADDIAELWEREENPLTEDLLTQFAVNVAKKTHKAFERRNRPREEKVLYASEIGTPCVRKLWYQYNVPHVAEPLPASAKTKFLYGDILEEYILLLARAAGHTVEREQEKRELVLGNGWTVRGRLDAYIDGALVDVKSASSFSYKKFKEGLTDDNDAFGYRHQLSFYGREDAVGTAQGFLVVDKQNGHIGWFPSEYQDDTVTRIGKITSTLDKHSDITNPPPRQFVDVPDGKSGNMKLCMECSYCPFKHHCWPGLKGYAYSFGPVWLTEVKREPNVPRIS